MGVNSTLHISHCSAENFRHYVDWRLKTYNISKQSTIWVEWKFLRLMYKRDTGRKMDELMGNEVSEVRTLGSIQRRASKNM
jgi:hypothetical protein